MVIDLQISDVLCTHDIPKINGHIQKSLLAYAGVECGALY